MSKFKKYFNSNTISGRANVAKATYASFAALYLIHRLRKKGNKPEDEHKDDHSAKSLEEKSHHHTLDPKTEPEPSCPCKCNENLEASNGHNSEHIDNGHNGKNSHPGNGGNHGDHSGADATHSNPSNHAHHNGPKNEKLHNDHQDTHGKSAGKVSYDQSKFKKFQEFVGFIHGR